MKSGKTSSSQSAPKTKVVDRMLHGCTHLLKANEDDHEHLDTFGNIQSTHWLFHRDSSHPKLKLEGCQKSWMFEAKLSLSWFLLEVLAREKREM